MAGRVWNIVLSLLAPAPQHLGRLTFDLRTILIVGFRVILHDRPLCWACDARHCPAQARPPRLPHPNTLSRRWRGEDLQQEVTRTWRACAVSTITCRAEMHPRLPNSQCLTPSFSASRECDAGHHHLQRLAD